MNVTSVVNGIENAKKTSVITRLLETAADIIDWLQRAYWLLPIIVAIVGFFFAIFVFRRKCKRITLNSLEKYSRSGKYLRGLFVELNDSKEYIRAFCFSKLWKQKVIKKYNTLFNDKMGRELPKVFTGGKEVRTKLSSRDSISKTKKEIVKMKGFLQSIHNRELTCNPAYMNTDLFYECFGSNYIRSINKIDQFASYLDTQYLIATGTAGNGKSMMLCSVAELLTSHNETVLFLGARDIKEDLFSHLSRMFIPTKQDKKSIIWKLLWRLQNIIHAVNQKNIYIIIDAINENDNEAFFGSLSESIEALLGYNHVKLIVSCRSEYFELKYRENLMIKDMEKRGCFLDIQGCEYTYEARERLLDNYARHYNFTGELSESVKEKVMKQLLLVRMLFELYAGKSDKIFELNKYVIYQKYIEGREDKELVALLKELTRYMYENEKYEDVPLSEIGQFSKSYDAIDSSVLVCRDLKKHEGNLREETEEVINFVYDEMRDYRLSTYLLKNCEDGIGEVNCAEVKRRLNGLIARKAACVEGIVNYLFNYFLECNNTDMIEYLLFNVIKNRDDHLDEYRTRRSKQISSWGLLLLFETNTIDLDYGKKYIDYILDNNPGQEGRKLLVYLLRQEFLNGAFNLDILSNALMRASSKEKTINRIEHSLASSSGAGVSGYVLVELHKELKELNAKGADRLLVLMRLIVEVFSARWTKRVIDYLKELGMNV